MIKKINWTLLLILLIALALRGTGLNWDQGAHLHPDERFLTMVVSAMKTPTSLSTYLDPSTSPMNPSNLNFPFFVYGTLPLTATFFIARLFHMADYDGVLLVGRGISVLLDMSMVLGVYLLAKLLYGGENKMIPIWSAVAYTLTVFAIQQAHFFTVDVFATAGMLWAIVFSLWYAREPKVIKAILLSLSLVLGVASKITSVLILPLTFSFFLISWFIHKKKRMNILFHGGLVGILSIFLTRLANPYYFSTSSWFDWHINPSFQSSLQQLQQLSTADAQFPPAVQWITKVAILFPLQQIIMFGCGVVLACLSAYGVLCLVMYGTWSKKSVMSWCGGALVVWSLAFFSYYGVQFAKTMRYLYILYPLIAIVAGYGASHWATHWWKKSLLIGLLCIWPLSFISIYQVPHSRVVASRWMLENIPSNSRVSYEHWDDALPVQAEGLRPGPYTYEELAVFAPDDQSKWDVLDKQLSSLDYLILSSNRGYGSIMSVPNRYPRMTAWYGDLFAGRTPFVKVAEFSSYPGLCLPNFMMRLFKTGCWEFKDSWAEEAFTVYDHPVVMIYKRIP